jgi:hypothetical protein
VLSNLQALSRTTVASLKRIAVHTGLWRAGADCGYDDANEHQNREEP